MPKYLIAFTPRKHRLLWRSWCALSFYLKKNDRIPCFEIQHSIFDIGYYNALEQAI